MTPQSVRQTLENAIENHRRLEATWNDGTIKLFEPARIESESETALTVVCTSTAEEGSPPDDYHKPSTITLEPANLTSLNSAP